MKATRLFTTIFTCAIILFAGCSGKDDPVKKDDGKMLTLSTDICYLDFNGVGSNATFPAIEFTIDSESDWTLSFSSGANTYFKTNISRGGNGEHTITVQFTPAFVAMIEGGGSLHDNLAGSLYFTNNSGTEKEFKVYYMGAGTAACPRMIFTVAELQAVNNNIDWHYLLMNDLTVDNWLPIGNCVGGYAENLFSGSVDGQGYSVILNSFSTEVQKGINNNYYYGLIGYMGKAGQVKNLHVQVNAPASSLKTDGRVSYGGIAGAMVSYHRVGIENCRVSGTLAVNSAASDIICIGGIVGRVDDLFSELTNCVSEAAINVVGEHMVYAGGLVGGLHGGKLSYSYATGAVNATGSINCSVGGLVGNSLVGTITSCVALCGSVTNVNTGSGTTDTGRILGYRSSSTFTNNYANSAMTVNGAIVSTFTDEEEIGVTLSTTQSQNWWSSNPGFTFSASAWKWDANTKMPKLYWEE